MDPTSVATVTTNGAGREIKEWQAIMDHLRSLPVKAKGELLIIPIDQRAQRGQGDQSGGMNAFSKRSESFTEM